MARRRPVRPVVRSRVAAALLAVALSGTACAGPDVIGGSGRALAPATRPAVATPSRAVPTSTSPAASTSGRPVSAGLALLRGLRGVSTGVWHSISDPRTGSSFSLPAVVPARTKLQYGISQRVYEHRLSKQSTISVSYVRTASAATAAASLGLYPTQLLNSVRALGADDAEVVEREVGTRDGRSTLSFRFRFTPTSVPQIPPAWLVTAIADGADIVLAQTIVFPPSGEYDYLRLARVAQQRLVRSLRKPS